MARSKRDGAAKPRQQMQRRMFLRGAAGFTLAIPFLPSLLARDAEAADDGVCKRFIAMGTNHGGIWGSSMYPGDTALTETANYAGREIRRGNLVGSSMMDGFGVSPVLSAQGLTPALLAKMNLIRGLDVPFYLAHHRGGHLGNYADNDGNGADGTNAQQLHRPTIDQVLAWSNAFYPDLGGILQRSLVMGGNGMSWEWSNGATQDGVMQRVDPSTDSLALFNQIFVPPPDPGETRPLVVDRVIEDYRRLRNSNRRLSTADRIRLDDHIGRLDELQRKLNVDVSCGNVVPPTTSSNAEYGPSFSIDPAANMRFWQLMNDVIVVAFTCDTTRIASMFATEHFSTFAGDWHQDVAHQANVSASQHAEIADGHQKFFEGVFVDLITKLDQVVDPNGGTLLDNSLVQWTHECGAVTHDPIELPVVTAGGAAGALQTGHYADFRNLNSVCNTQHPLVGGTHSGLIYNQWLGTVLQSMGLAPAEYETGGNGGYGELIIGTETFFDGYQKYGAPEFSVMGDLLPFVT